MEGCFKYLKNNYISNQNISATLYCNRASGDVFGLNIDHRRFKLFWLSMSSVRHLAWLPSGLPHAFAYTWSSVYSGVRNASCNRHKFSVFVLCFEETVAN